MMALLTLIPWWGKLAAIAVVVAALAVGYAAWRHSIYQEGYDDAMAAIAAQDAKALAARDAAVSRVRECHDSGMRWDQSARQCVGP
jgi:hypothetical protein